MLRVYVANMSGLQTCPGALGQFPLLEGVCTTKGTMVTRTLSIDFRTFAYVSEYSFAVDGAPALYWAHFLKVAAHILRVPQYLMQGGTTCAACFDDAAVLSCLRLGFLYLLNQGNAQTGESVHPKQMK